MIWLAIVAGGDVEVDGGRGKGRKVKDDGADDDDDNDDDDDDDSDDEAASASAAASAAAAAAAGGDEMGRAGDYGTREGLRVGGRG